MDDTIVADETETVTEDEARVEEAEEEWEYPEAEEGGEEAEVLAPDFTAEEVYEAPMPLDDEIFSPTGLHIDMSDMGMPEWARLGGTVYKLAEQSPFWLGDWWNLGEDKFGEEAYQVYDVSDFLTFKTVSNKAKVSAAVPEKIRQPTLTYSHHREVVGLPTVPQRRKALRMAAEGKNVRGVVECDGKPWTTRQMTDYVKSIIKPDDDDAAEKGETTSITWSFSFNLAPADEAGGDQVAEQVHEAIEKILADAGLEARSINGPSKSYNES